jgi:LmbE family N-acetylglucosaminyl deacetylase
LGGGRRSRGSGDDSGVVNDARPPVRLAGVFAHPDDDVYTIGGTLLLHPGTELTLVFATSGGAGPISDPELATRATLADVREREQRASLDVLGYSNARVHWLRHPDYYLPDVDGEQLAVEIAEILDRARPHVVVTFGPDGLTSHHDHVRVGEATTAAFHRLRGDANRDGAFSHLYYIALARSDVDRFYDAAGSNSFAYGKEGRLFDITGVPDESIAVRVDTRSVQDRKLEGMLCHRTQRIEHERIPESLRWIHLDSECFVQAYPQAAPSSPTRSNLFDDVMTDPSPAGAAEARRVLDSR